MEASVSLYELNRQIIKQQGPLEEKDIKSKMDILKTFSHTFEKYSLLYGKEINYFTLFVKDKNWEKIVSEYEISISDNPVLNAALFDNLKVYGNISMNDKLTLDDRIYKCDVCGIEIDRDINAAINILNA